MSVAVLNIFWSDMAPCMQLRTSAKLSTSGRERERQTLQATHEQAEGKLKAELQKKNSLLSSCKADAERLRAEVQSLKAEQNRAAEGHGQTAETLQEQALSCQKMAGSILRCLSMACRLTLRSSAAMRAGAPPPSGWTASRSISVLHLCPSTSTGTSVWGSSRFRVAKLQPNQHALRCR